MAMAEEEAREAYFEMQAIEQQMKQLSQQIMILENQLNEFQNSIEAIGSLKSGKGGEVFVPISSGIYTKAELKNSNDFIVNVGANVAVEKSGEAVVEILRKQVEEMNNYREQMLKGMQLLESRSREIQQKIIGG